jgi:feruloyl esterase
MAHCYSGPGASNFGGVGQQIPPKRDPLHDIQTALEAWVEAGAAPDRLVATKYADDAPQSREIKFTRALCPYPSVARYKGSGDATDASSFICTSQ